MPPSTSTPHRSSATHLIKLVGPTSSGAPVTRHPPLFVIHGFTHTFFQTPFRMGPQYILWAPCARNLFKIKFQPYPTGSTFHFERRPEEPLRSATRNNWGSSDLQGNPQNLNALGYGVGAALVEPYFRRIFHLGSGPVNITDGWTD